MSQHSWKTVPEEKGYSWLFFYVTKPWLLGMFITIAVVAVGGSFYVWYSQFGDDVAPDSIVGLIFAVAGTICFILAALLYMIHRRSHRRAIGQLHTSLQWHIFLAIMGLALLLMHSFGNFNARTGTYALYGLVALVVSGFVGRLVDRIMPRLIAAEVAKTLTAQGEDRAETISQQLKTFTGMHTQYPQYQQHTQYPYYEQTQPSKLLPRRAHSVNPVSIEPLNTPWDLAYRPLEATGRRVKHRRMAPGQSVLQSPAAPPLWMPNIQSELAVVEMVQRAHQREQFYRAVIRYWRIFHIALALLTLGLVIWHLVFVVQLLVFHMA